MNLPYSMDEARVKILEQGIQQTNRYAFYYPRYSKGLLYPYNITLPGLGYDFIDHSIWSIPRKIPFRKTHTDLEVTFIMGKKNYSNSINLWNQMITSPKLGVQNGGPLRSQEASRQWAQQNGVSPLFGEDEGTPEGLDEAIRDVIPNFPIVNFDRNAVSENIPGFIPGTGGASNYMDDIYQNDLIIYILNETDMSPTFAIKFEEAYVSQVAQVQMTSVETGYSPFKIFFKFTQMQVI
jgi:hypothetical protein